MLPQLVLTRRRKKPGLSFHVKVDCNRMMTKVFKQKLADLACQTSSMPEQENVHIACDPQCLSSSACFLGAPTIDAINQTPLVPACLVQRNATILCGGVWGFFDCGLNTTYCSSIASWLQERDRLNANLRTSSASWLWILELTSVLPY